MITYMVLNSFQKNTELNAGGIIASSNVNSTATIYLLVISEHAYGRNTELYACGIHVSSDVPTNNINTIPNTDI